MTAHKLTITKVLLMQTDLLDPLVYDRKRQRPARPINIQAKWVFAMQNQFTVKVAGQKHGNRSLVILM